MAKNILTIKYQYQTINFWASTKVIVRKSKELKVKDRTFYNNDLLQYFNWAKEVIVRKIKVRLN